MDSAEAQFNTALSVSIIIINISLFDEVKTVTQS